jgi:tetratricopeptide (TPR) repeat protein
VLRLELEAWIAQAAGEADTAVARMREAAELEAATPKHAVTPGPTLPAEEQLGDLLSAQGKPAEALAAYRRSLELYPRRLNSVLGAARAARAAGDEPAARALDGELLELAGRGTRQAALDEARRSAPGQ